MNGIISSDNGPRESSTDPSTVESDETKIESHLTKEDVGVKRAGWGSKLEFFLTLVGYAVGLGNVWRFPYLAYSNGGGAFLLPYFLMLVLIGLPIMLLETSFGQFSSLGPVAAWKMSPLFKGVGIAAIINNSYFTCYYSVIVSWCLYYLLASMGSDVPWRGCENYWNTPQCFDGSNYSAGVNMSMRLNSPSEEFFYNRVLRLSSGISHPERLVWQLVLLLLLTWTIIFIVNHRGIQSMGKVMYFVSLFPYVLLTIMLIRGVTLDGARQGIEFYIRPNWTRLTELKVWSDAGSQICYALGVCSANIIAMSSYNQFKNNLRRDALTVPFISAGTSFYAGFVIFSVLGFMAKRKGVTVAQVAAGGPGLVFVVYPEGLAQMPVSPLWSILFFFMLSTLGFSSEFSANEATATVFMDEFPALTRGNRPVLLRLCLCIAMFLLALPMVTSGGYYLFQIVDDFGGGYTLLIVGFLEVTIVSYVYGHSRFSEDIAIMLGSRPGIYWQIMWRVVNPVIFFLLIIFKAVYQGQITWDGPWGTYVYPVWANVIAWLIVAFPLFMVVSMATFQCCIQGGYQVLKKAAGPAEDWGPADEEDREGTIYAIRDRQSKAMAKLADSSLRSRKIATLSEATNPSFDPADDAKANGGTAIHL